MTDIPNSNDLDSFLERIIQNAANPKAGLGKLISNNDLSDIYSYILKFNDLKNINKLKPGQALHLSKEETGLARTLNILRTKDGEFWLILETKSKLATKLTSGKYEKQKLPLIGGAFKSGKPAWRIDSHDGPIELFNLTLKEDQGKTSEIHKVKDEVEISQDLSFCEYINVNQLGAEFDKGQVRKVSVYSVRAPKTLKDLITESTHKDEDFNVTSTMDEKQKSILKYELMLSVKAVHDSNRVHQDLKPENILLTLGDDGFYHVKLTDFGLTVSADSTTPVKTTMTYQSPEIAYAYSDTTLQDHTYYNSPTSYRYLGMQTFDALRKQQFQENIGSRAECLKPHKANDIWALGLIMYEIDTSNKPKLQVKNNITDPVILGMLSELRQNRPTIEQALTNYRKQDANFTNSYENIGNTKENISNEDKN